MVPVWVDGQLQVYPEPPALLLQVPPFRQGALLHGNTETYIMVVFGIELCKKAKMVEGILWGWLDRNQDFVSITTKMWWWTSVLAIDYITSNVF